MNPSPEVAMMEPKSYLRIKFKEADGKARWYWALKVKDGIYLVVNKYGDELTGVYKEGVLIEKKKYLWGEAEIERPARMSLHYGELEEANP